jgi:hypothetical protein
MARQGIIDAALRGHAAHCPTCRDTLAVAAWMQELAGLTVMDARLPDPVYLWWKAELLRRWDAEQRAAAPIELGERVQVGIALVGAVALLICLWRDASRLATSSSSLLIGSDLGPLLSVAMTVSTLLLVAIAAVACRHLFVGERV